MSTEEKNRQELARRTCQTCACWAHMDQTGQWADEPGPTVQTVCTLNPPAAREVEAQFERPILKPDGSAVVINGKPRTEMVKQRAFIAFYPPAPPHFRCYQWRPSHVLPGVTHWLPPRSANQIAGNLPAPAGD